MVTTIIPNEDETHLDSALAAFRQAEHVAALTGAGISVESGIPDFRSRGGLWEVFAPGEYATLEVFRADPAKAWKLYRALGATISGKQPNAGHRALAELEKAGHLDGLVTQNVDGLHQAAGSERVLEIHGEHTRLQCLRCDRLEPITRHHLDDDATVPTCGACGDPLKPNVVLFGESVRCLDEIEELLTPCDLLLVIGTSAQVHPAAALPAVVKANGGLIFEFNVEPTELTRGDVSGLPFAPPVASDFFFHGRAGATLPLLLERLRASD